ncbi:hypothetical protein [Helicobacter trogontum]|uniref:hypothetical protein n=2 Tax=Helicobacter trogontum TaxID=50960 RepID=UPI002A90949E|nr:hypothetical protein [Helicobacter trogontum]MDY5185997.1 hypothetical protein [Helicobacter trogontum]
MENLRVLLKNSCLRIFCMQALCFTLISFYAGCSVQHTKKDDRVVYLGRLHNLQILPNTLPKKPQKEIARICVSFTPFNASKQYRILTFENLLKEAYKNTAQYTFTKVGIWQQSWNMLIWQKKCLILGNVNAK